MIRPLPYGDREIDDVLAPWPPLSCSAPVLLIRNAGSGAWFTGSTITAGAARAGGPGRAPGSPAPARFTPCGAGV